MHSKLAGHLPLQDLIASTLNSARTKLAAAEESEKKKVNPFAKKNEEKGESKKEEKEEHEKEKKSSALDPFDPGDIEKLASALDEIGEEFLKESDSIENGGESHQGGEQIATNSPVGGKQPYKKDGSKKHQIPTSTGMEARKETGPAATAVPDTLHSPPVPLNSAYPSKGVLKTAFAVTQAGHKFDAAKARAKQEEQETHHDANKAYGGAVGKLDAFNNKLTARNEAYKASKHEAGKNAYNPWGGMRTPTDKEKSSGVARLQAAIEKQAAFAATAKGHEYESKAMHATAKKDFAVSKASQEYRKANPILSRLPGTPGSGKGDRIRARKNEYGANEHAQGANSSGKAGRGLPSSYEKADLAKSSSAVDFIMNKISESATGGMTLDSQSGVGPKPESGSAGGNDARSALESSTAAINMKKVDGKKPQKRMLSEVLTEPALTSSTDSKVNENLRNASKGGVKIAAARAYLAKVAADESDPKHEALKKALAKKQEEKGEKKDEEKSEEKSS
jgi:hypothetical protein